MPVDKWRGEPPFNMWEGIADGFGAGGEPEPMTSEREEDFREIENATNL